MHYISPYNISFHELESCSHPDFDELYKIYTSAFPLDNEREEPDAIDQVLAFNSDAKIQKNYGISHEILAAIKLGTNGQIIGGIMFSCITSQVHLDANIYASVQLVYLFLAPQMRGLFPMRTIAVDYCKSYAKQLFYNANLPNILQPLVMLEVNNPLRMSDAQINDDITYSKINPFQRYLSWQSINALPLDFSYTQLKLRPDSEAIPFLDLFCIADDFQQGIPSAVLLQHLYSFCSISVLKGTDARLDNDFLIMEQSLKKNKIIKFVSPVTLYPYIARGEQ